MILSLVLKAYRQANGLSLKSLSRRMGICYVTLHRLEHGRPVMSTELIKIWRWLMGDKL